MNTEFSKNLPKEKKVELKKIVETIKKHAKVEMIILFGSYARGDFVDYDEKEFEGHIESYASDFDILVVLRSQKLAKEYDVWFKIEDEIEAKKIITPVNIIPESVHHIQEQLQKKRYFYTDVLNDGILLYESKDFKLEIRAGELTKKERKAVAREDFQIWFKKAKRFFDYYEIGVEKKYYNEAAFHLHQTTESLFSAILLVFRGYKQKTHDLLRLNRQVCKHDKALKKIFPRKTDKEQHLFTLLKRAYVDARYSKDYKITKIELRQIAKQVEKLLKLTEQICKAEIKAI